MVLLFLAAHPLAAFELRLSGRVVDENDAPVAGARITVRPTGQQALSDPTGAFHITLPSPGDYLVNVQREGYYELKDHAVQVQASQEVMLVVNTVREVFQTVNVNEQPSPVDLAQTRHEERLSGTEINDVPYPSSHSLRNSMRLLPGVVQDQRGGLHFNGSSEDQVLYLLNGFNITDPITGMFQSRVGVEGVRSLQYWSGRYSPEFGKGSAGVMAIRTDSGTDQFHYTATNFIPGLDIQQGVRLGNWYPRFGVSGPIVKGRAWFADNFDAGYTQSLITGLPKGQDTRSGLAGSNLLHTQVNVTPSNILFADFLVNLDNEGRVGLGPLDPISTTTEVHTRQYFASVKDQVYFGHGSLVEFGYAHNRFGDRVTPQGSDLYMLSPQGRSGNYFIHSNQTASRDEGMIDAYLPTFRLAGTHQVKAGVDADHLSYTGHFRRTGYELFGLSGQLISTTMFQGRAHFRLKDNEQASYVLDTWRLTKRLQIDAGVRQDWDQQIGDVAWSPRVSFAWSPFESGHTRISGGYAITYDAVNFNLLGRPLDQPAVTTRYNADGTAAGPPALTTFTRGNGRLELPKATNWSAEIDHQFTARLFVSASYLRRRVNNGFTYVNSFDPNAPPSELPIPGATVEGEYQLTNLRRDNYNKVELTVRQTFAGQYEWTASYTHSRAVSNAVLDLNLAQPLQVVQTLEPVPWDSPNRVIGWAYLPTPWKNWAVAILADARTGFPFSIQDETGRIIGTVDSHRYPFNFDLNIAVERMITLRGYRFALRGGMNNVTNRQNPTAVTNTVGSPQFLQFYGLEGRHFVVRVRFFGRADKK